MSAPRKRSTAPRRSGAPTGAGKAPRPGDGNVEADPDPLAGLPRWHPCGRCGGRGELVVRELTEQLRRQGQPFTVVGPCPACGGAGGMLDVGAEGGNG